jgi:putative ABC transport system substrate-binding protein
MKLGNSHQVGNSKIPGAFGVVICAVLLAFCPPASAQHPEKVHRVGYLAAASGPSPFLAAFKQGLRELGYVQGRNVTIEYRASEARDQLNAMAAELVKLKVDVILAQGPAARAAKSVTTTVPIVFGFSGDPVEAGFVESLARPGTNMTGMSFMAQDLAGKRMELLKEAAAHVGRIAIISLRTHPGEKKERNETEAAARALKTELQYLPVTSTSDIETAFEAIVKERPEAMLTFPDAVTLSYRSQLANFAIQRKLPSMFGWKEYVETGGLISYGPNLDDSFSRIAVFVDKIFKGAKPADLPVEQPTKFELVINLKTAKQIGVTISPVVLARADRVIR